MVFNIFKKGPGPNGEEKAESASESASGALADLLKFMVVKLVDNPNDVEVREVQGDRTTVLELKVNESDMGKVIGKKGRIIKSLRIVVRAAAVHEGKSVSIELVN